MHRFVRSLISLIVIVAAVLAVRIHERTTASETVRQDLVELCSEDSDCLGVVETRFSSCFDAAFDLGGRRNTSRLDTRRMAQCLNEGSSTDFFGVAK